MIKYALEMPSKILINCPLNMKILVSNYVPVHIENNIFLSQKLDIVTKRKLD